MNNFIDTHAHIYSEYYSDIPSIIKFIGDMGIIKVINAGCDINTSKEVLDLSKKYSILYSAVGIHPEYVDRYKEEDITLIEGYLKEKRVVAIGEIGLDYHYSKDNKDKQINLFEKQLSIAEKYNYPVVIHSREATEDTIKSLRKFNVRGVIHSFSGSLETARIYESMGFVLGINGVVTFKNSNLRNILSNIDLKNIVLETDSPYLSPEPKRGKKNDSSNILIIAEFLANLYNIPLEEISKITNENAYRIFDKLREK